MLTLHEDKLYCTEQFDSNQSITIPHEILKDKYDKEVLGIIGQNALHLFDKTNLKWLDNNPSLGYSPHELQGKIWIK